MSRRYGYTIRVTRADGDANRDDGGSGDVWGMEADSERHEDTEMPAPQSIVWRGVPYQVAEVLSTWHLRDRWWQAGPVVPRDYQPDVAAPPGREDHVHRADVARQADASRASSDRYYYRVCCRYNSHDLLCDLYYDAVSGVWVLDRVHD